MSNATVKKCLYNVLRRSDSPDYINRSYLDPVDPVDAIYRR